MSQDMGVLDAIRDRRSIRRYRPDPVPLDAIEKIIDAGRWAPTGANRQYWKFIAVTDPKIMRMIKRVSPMMWGDSPAAILVCLDLDRSSLGEEARRGYGEIAGFPSQNIMLAAHALGLGTCPIGGFNKRAVTDILDVPDDMDVHLLITLGYPDEAPEKKPRRPMSEVAYLNSCRNPWREADG